MLWVLTKCQDSGVVNYLLKQGEVSEQASNARVLGSRWSLKIPPSPKPSSVFYLLRFTQHPMSMALMFLLHAKGKQKKSEAKVLGANPLGWPRARSVTQPPLCNHHCPPGIILSLPFTVLEVLAQSQLSFFSSQFVQ